MPQTLRNLDWFFPALIVVAGAACSTPAPDCPSVTPADVAAPPARSSGDAQPAKPVGPSMELDGVTVVGAAELFSKRLGEPLVVDVGALPQATCTRIRIKVGGGSTPRDALDGLDAVLSGSGLRSERGPGKHRIVVDGDPRRASCSIETETWAKWIGPGVRKIDDSTLEITRASFGLITSQYVQFNASGGNPPPGKQGVVAQSWGHFEVFELLGMKAGDLVVSVQGEPITFGTGWTSLMKKIRGDDRVVVAIERGGKPMSLTYVIVP